MSLTENSFAIKAPGYFEFKPLVFAPKQEAFSLYQDKGWYVVNDYFIDDMLLNKRDLEFCSKELNKCLESPPEVSSWEIIKTPAFYITISAALAAGLLIGYNIKR